MKKTIITLLIIFSFVWVNAQSPLDKRVDFSIENAKVKEALRQLSLETDVSIAYSSNFFDRKKRVSIDVKNERIENILIQILKGQEVNYKAKDNQIIITLARPKPKRKFTISGFVEDEKTGERLIAVTVYCIINGIGTTTNEYGFYSLTLPEGKSELVFRYVGCGEVRKTIDLTKSIQKSISLESSSTLSEVVVLSGNNQSLIEKIHNDHSATLEKLKQMPVLGRGDDLIKQLNFLPGVETGVEGLGGFFIRGGNIDQNLTLMDGVNIYNPSHLLGLFSVFNTDAIKSSKLYKGDFPARFGGRISSVLDVRTKDGNIKKYSGIINPGFLSSRMNLEGPLWKNKIGFFTNYRSSEIGILRTVSKNIQNNNLDIPALTFFDFNLKLHFKFSPKDKLHLSIYAGQDRVRTSNTFNISRTVQDTISTVLRDSVNQESRVDWGNSIFALRWNHLFSDKLFSNTTITFSRFSFDLNALETTRIFEDDEFTRFEFGFQEYKNQTIDVGLKFDFDYIPSPKHYIRFGGGILIHGFGRNNEDDTIVLDEVEGLPEEDPTIEELTQPDFYEDERGAIDFHAYLEDEIKFSKRLKANLGLRVSAFFNDEENGFSALEPRINANYLLSKNWLLKGALTRNFQTIHLLTNTGLGLPIDIWVPSVEEIEPQTSWQKSLAIQFKNDNSLRFMIEGYHKKMNNMIFLRKSIFQFESLSLSDSTFIQGEGTAYGLEFSLEKDWKKVFAFAYYTLSKSDRFFEGFNQNNSFPFQYDRRHSVKIGMNWKATKRMDFGATWTLHSGTPRIYEELFSEIEDLPSPETFFPLGQYNQLRTPSYHRLDLKFNWKFQKKYGLHRLGASLYNAYFQPNVTYYERIDASSNDPISIVPIAIPSVNYSFRF